MSTIWGPAYDAEIAYRRETLAAAAMARRGGRERGRRSRRGSGGSAARAARAARVAEPAVATRRRTARAGLVGAGTPAAQW